MKAILLKLVFMGLTLLTHSLIFSQGDVIGSWKGELDVPGMKLPIVFHIATEGEGMTSTLDSPSQGAMGIPTSGTTYENDTLKINIAAIGGSYVATLTKDTLLGIFSQGGMKFPLNLTMGEVEAPKRPQEPKAPFPYKIEEVVFSNSKANDIKLAGTLTIPENVDNPPVAIMITGSGPQDRDEALMGHKPFHVIADHMTRNGIAVLRYDDRGFGASEGDFSSGTSFDFASDVEAAVLYLKGRGDVVDVDKIGLIGHSEGGLIAPIVASKDKSIAFSVLLAGPGVTGKEILVTQTTRALELSGELNEEEIAFNEKISVEIFDLMINESEEGLAEKITDLMVSKRDMAPLKLKDNLKDEDIANQVKQITSTWMLSFIKFDPSVYLNKLTSPVLAINGEKDFQVLPKINLEGIEKGLKIAGNKDYTIKELADMNHLFQTCETGAMYEYAQIEETFSPVALKLVSDWINERF